MQRLSESEEYVMSVIWLNTNDTLNLYDIVEHVNQKFGRKWKPQTVATYITRLIKKEYLETYKPGRFTYYKPKVTLESYRNKKINELQMLCFNSEQEMQRYLNR